MSPVLRGSLIAASIAGAFAAGFFLKPRLAPADAGQTPAAAVAPKGVPVSAWSKGGPPLVPQQQAPQQKPTARLPDVRVETPVQLACDLPPVTPPPVPGSLTVPPPDLSDPGLRMVANSLNIKTTILDKNEPTLPVLGPPTGTPPIVEISPVPMIGPMPRLDLPPVAGQEPLMPPIVVPVPPMPIKLVNTRDIALDFAITKVGLSKVSCVELWTTRDGGKTWAKTDQMAGCQSPFRTRLGSEGHYGFRLVFESESGMRTSEPQPSDKPDLRIELDTTPPKIVILPPEAVAGQPGKIHVRWKMSDAHLAMSGIRHQYSSDGQTWNKLETVSPNAQDANDCYSLIWTMPANLPHQVMIRITAHDDAGNETTAQLPERVSIDLVAPQGKLTGIRPASGQEVGPKPREVLDANRAIFSFWVGMMAD